MEVKKIWDVPHFSIWIYIYMLSVSVWTMDIIVLDCWFFNVVNFHFFFFINRGKGEMGWSHNTSEIWEKELDTDSLTSLIQHISSKGPISWREEWAYKAASLYFPLRCGTTITHTHTHFFCFFFWLTGGKGKWDEVTTHRKFERKS
jgi:hypothetical protein